MEFELKQIKELMAAMGRSGATKLHLKLGDRELEIGRGVGHDQGDGSTHVAVPMGGPHHFPMPHTHFPPTPHHPQGVAPAPVFSEPVATEAEGLFVTAPMVGTMYYSPAPDEPAFVKVGDTIDASTVVCIIEAMKVMNEVKAGVSGTVAEILVPNGQPVEYGTKLIRIVS